MLHWEGDDPEDRQQPAAPAADRPLPAARSTASWSCRRSRSASRSTTTSPGQAGEQFEMTALPKAAEARRRPPTGSTPAGTAAADGDWWQEVGNWKVNRERFPNGLQADRRRGPRGGHEVRAVVRAGARAARTATWPRSTRSSCSRSADGPGQPAARPRQPAARCSTSPNASRRIIERSAWTSTARTSTSTRCPTGRRPTRPTASA